VTDIAGIVLTAADFTAPAVAVWYLVLRRTENPLDSALAAAGLSAFLMPSLMFVMNRSVGYPLDRTGLTALALILVIGAVVWHRVVAPRVSALRTTAVRLARLVGGTTSPDESDDSPPFT